MTLRILGIIGLVLLAIACVHVVTFTHQFYESAGDLEWLYHTWGYISAITGFASMIGAVLLVCSIIAPINGGKKL